MARNSSVEVWLRGQLPGLQPALQPVAHALLQASEEVTSIMTGFDETLLWQKPAGVACAGFHLQHMKGVLDRLFTYARAEKLSASQQGYLSAEGKNEGQTIEFLVNEFNQQVRSAIEQLSQTAAIDVFAARGVGRQQIPSTVIGLMVHAAEHTMRHLGQLLVTVNILQSGKP